MQANFQNGGKKLSCADFDAMLAEAIDGSVSGQALEAFQGHAADCGDCGPLFAQAQEGLKWLRQLESIEPPARLVRNILALTSMREPLAAPVAAGVDGRSWARRFADFITPNLAPAMARVGSPRFAMSGAMAFFSIMLVLNVSGVKLSDLKNLDLRPSAIRTSAEMTYQQTTAKVVRYYQNIRFVYELEARWKEIRNRQQGERSQDQEERREGEQQEQKPREQEQQQNQNYSLESGQVVMAKSVAPYVVVATDRREA
jgi:hypothetical protein